MKNNQNGLNTAKIGKIKNNNKIKNFHIPKKKFIEDINLLTVLKNEIALSREAMNGLAIEMNSFIPKLKPLYEQRLDFIINNDKKKIEKFDHYKSVYEMILENKSKQKRFYKNNIHILNYYIQFFGLEKTGNNTDNIPIVLSDDESDIKSPPTEIKLLSKKRKNNNN